MVNPARILAAAGAGLLQKRDTTAWTDVISTSADLWSEATSATVEGYYTTTLVAVGGVAVVSSLRETTLTTRSWGTSPLLSPSPLDPACTRALSAYERNLTLITRAPAEYYPIFQVGFNPTCLPPGFHTVDYYSPGICPQGYTIAFTPVSVSTVKPETAVRCCYDSYKWDETFGCVSYYNPAVMTSDSGSPAPATATAHLSAWTVIAEYTTVATSTSIYTTGAVSGGVVTSLPTTSVTEVRTTTGHTIISGDDGAYVVGPGIVIRWASTDQAVLDWLAQQPGFETTTPGPSTPPSPPPPPRGSNGLSGGAIAGVAIGAVAGLALIIGALLFWLRRRKQRATTDAYGAGHIEEPKPQDDGMHGPVYVESVVPKTELDSRALSAEQYAAQSAMSSPQTDYKPFMPPAAVGGHARDVSSGGYIAYRPPPSEVEATEITAISPSVAGSTISPPDRARSPSEWTDSTAQVETDMSGFMIKDGSTTTGPRTSVAQLEKLKEERARLQRLQEIAEQEARLEEQLERELAAERQA